MSYCKKHEQLFTEVDCDHCHGTGEVIDLCDDFYAMTICRPCGGSGNYFVCELCQEEFFEELIIEGNRK